MMAKWLHPVVLICVIRTTNLEGDEGSCRTHASPLDWPQITCVRVNSHFFASFPQPLNRTHWIKCANCSLDVIDERTFPFPKNNVSYLELTHDGIRSVKKYAFRHFFLLKLLYLYGNEIDYLEPNCFSGLKRLFYLDLSNNALKILTNNIFADLVNLDLLNLNNNRIFYVQPYAFDGLVNLKYLYLNNNDLKKLEDGTFKYLIELKILYVEHNGIVEIHQNAFKNLRNLNYLYLNNNSISFLVQYNFKPLTSLVDLQLRSNALKEVQVSSFNGLKNLRSLYLGDNNIKTVKPYGFIGLDSLAVLDLVNNDFTELHWHYFDKIQNLHLLWLNNNSISRFEVDSNSDRLERLVQIDLSSNPLGEFDYKLLYEKAPSIRQIVLINNSFSCDFFSNLYSFSSDKNVSVCVLPSCSFNHTETYLDSVCSETATTEISLNSTDFSLNKAGSFFTPFRFYGILLFVVFSF